MTTTYDPAKDPYAQRSVPVDSQGRSAIAVTKSDTVDISVGPNGSYAKAIYVGVAGNVTILPVDAVNDTDVVLFPNHPVGYMPMQVRRIMSTGTTASGFVALGA